MDFNEKFLKRALEIASESIADGGGPFGAVIVIDDQIFAEAGNSVTTTFDPTAHAEVNAIRKACEQLHHFELKDAVLYASCEPCPMCLSAIYWARIKKVYFAASRFDAADAGFDDDFLYKELEKPLEERNLYIKQIPTENKTEPFLQWKAFDKKTPY